MTKGQTLDVTFDVLALQALPARSELLAADLASLEKCRGLLLVTSICRKTL